MRGKILAHLVVLSMVMSSCGQVAVKPPDNLPDLVTDHIITAYDHYYPGSTVELSVKLSMTPKEIWFGGNNNLKKSANSLVDGIWQDSLALKEFNIGQVSISVVLSLNDGTKKKLYKMITVVKAPQINIEQSRTSKTGDKLIVWADVELSKVEYIDPNGQTTPFVKKDKEFTLDEKLPEPGKPAGTIRTTDSLGAVSEKQMSASGIDEPRVYYVEDNTYQYDEVAKVGRQMVTEASLDSSYKKPAFEVVLKQAYDKDLAHAMETNKAYGPEQMYYIRLKCLSKDREWAILTTYKGQFITDRTIIEDGKLLREVTVNFTYLYNTKTKEQRLIGKRVIKNYKGYVSETGPVYFPVFIDDDEILLIEQNKDGKMYQLVTDSMDLNNQYRAPVATARGVALSLKDLQIRPTDRVKPVSPWVSYADMSNGIIGYAELPKNCLECGNAIPDGCDFHGFTSYYCDLMGNRIFKWEDLSKHLEKYTNRKFSEYTGCIVAGFGTYNDNFEIYLIGKYHWPNAWEGEWEGPDRPETTASKIFRYLPKTDQMYEIRMNNLYSIYGGDTLDLYPKQFNSSFGITKPIILISIEKLYNGSYYSCSIYDNDLRQLGANGFEFADHSNIFILPGGEQ